MITAGELSIVAAVVLGVSVAGVLAGAVLLRLVRRRTLWASVAVVIGIASLVMAAGVVTLSRLMLVSGDAFAVLLVAVGTAAVASAVVAATLVRRIARSSAELADAAGRVGAGQTSAMALEPDTRELRALAAALEDADRRLAESRARERAIDDARRELVAWVSHDLRSPVAGLRAMAEALEDGVVTDDEVVAEYHRRMRGEAVRLGRMIDDLFELSGLHAGALVVRPRRIVLCDVIDEVVQAAEPVAAAAGVSLSWRSDGVVLDADPDKLARVLRNLVSNAIRHTPAGGAVTVDCVVPGDVDRVVGGDVDRAAASAGMDDARIDAAVEPLSAREVAVVTVRDECGGIPEAELPRLFDVGFRGQWARTPGDDVGAGLGLAIARGIVEAHGGRIVVSNAGTGCAFAVHIPLRAATDVAAQRSSTRA